jgi:two-component system OmpR family response regulator
MIESGLPIILVVENEALLLLDAETTLQDAGYQVITATDGPSASAEIEKGEIRGLVTDINLGRGPTGWDIARRARELRSDLPVVYVSGEHSLEWTSQGVPNSVMIAKPYAPAQLVTAISILLNAVPPAEN